MIVLVIAAFYYLGAQVARRVHERHELSWLERASSAALIGSAIWIAVSWLLSFPHWLTRPALVVAGLIAAIVAFIIRTPTVDRPHFSTEWLLLLPLGCWLLFVIWRALILPIGSADALIYHMPRAVEIARAGGYTWIPNAPDPRINGVAANYEMLLADVVAVQRTDKIAELTSVVFFILFVLVSTTIARRWWGNGRFLFLVPYLIAGVPLVVLHAGAIKNDLMSHFFALSALLWGGRWFTTRRFADAALCVIALFAGLGTKNHLLLLTGVMGLVLLARRPSLRLFGGLAAVAVVAFILLGGMHYLHAVPQSGAGGVAPAQYGEWRNLWRFPVEIFLAPFSADDSSLVLPWTRTAIPWFRYDLYGSNYGQLVSIALLLLPLLLWVFRDRRADAPPIERYVVLAAGTAFFFLVMPAQSSPAGFGSYFARYLLIVPVLILSATIVPLLEFIDRTQQKNVGHLTAAAVILASLASIAAFATKDKWMPIDYVLNVAQQSDRRLYPPMPIRAAIIVDRVAGPRDRIDVHGGHDTYLYPVYGGTLSRNVAFITAPAGIRRDAQWVIVDRASNIFWHHPLFKTVEDWHRYWSLGEASAEDLSVVKTLMADKRFQVVFYSPRINQAVFRRVQ